ncbi:hypothetical protein Fmac_028786 [Flemingia macrophylla]|uniref:Uncharacterized protein n=1 Tax=Flemingia macrophylla TaxID=520843 RepID=A0ABD1L8H6_9FABA
MVIQETLRLYSPQAHASRTAFQDISLKGIEIPKGTNINIPVPILNQDPGLGGPDAHKFNPGRFENGVLVYLFYENQFNQFILPILTHFHRLSPVPLDHTSLPYLTAKEHQLINHLQLCPSMPHQHTMPPSLWLGPDSSIRISLDRVCPWLPPAKNNKLKGKKIYRGPMPTPCKMCIKSFPDMTHSRVQKKMHNTEFLESDAEKYYHQFMH